MPLTDDLAQLLLDLAQAPIPQAHAADEPTLLGQLLELERRGLTRQTTTNWVITDDGTRALVAADGRTRITVDTYRGAAQGGPA